jgi:hypothetical protein
MDADMVWWHIVSVVISSFTVIVLGWQSRFVMVHPLVLLEVLVLSFLSLHR